MYIWPHLLTPKYFYFFFFKAENVSTLTVTSNLILGEKPHTVAGLTINTSISFEYDIITLSVTIFTLLYKDIGFKGVLSDTLGLLLIP